MPAAIFSVFLSLSKSASFLLLCREEPSAVQICDKLAFASLPQRRIAVFSEILAPLPDGLMFRISQTIEALKRVQIRNLKERERERELNDEMNTRCSEFTIMYRLYN